MPGVGPQYGGGTGIANSRKSGGGGSGVAGTLPAPLTLKNSGAAAGFGGVGSGALGVTGNRRTLMVGMNTRQFNPCSNHNVILNAGFLDNATTHHGNIGNGNYTLCSDTRIINYGNVTDSLSFNGAQGDCGSALAIFLVDVGWTIGQVKVANFTFDSTAAPTVTFNSPVASGAYVVLVAGSDQTPTITGPAGWSQLSAVTNSFALSSQHKAWGRFGCPQAITGVTMSEVHHVGLLAIELLAP